LEGSVVEARTKPVCGQSSNFLSVASRTNQSRVAPLQQLTVGAVKSASLTVEEAHPIGNDPKNEPVVTPIIEIRGVLTVNISLTL
jgi:hypothetical protein